MLPRLPVYLLISLPVLLVQGSTTSSPRKSSAAPASPPPRPPPPLGDPSWALGLRLYQALRSDSSPVNTLFSPLLVASSLGALGGGSAGTTASQLQNLLNTPSPSKAGAQAGDLLSRALKSFAEANLSTFHLHTSSAVFSKQAPAVSQAFVKDSQARFRLQHQPLGKGDSKADLKQLHGWAKAGLGGLEGAPLKAEIQAKAGALILANALRFKGLWEREFSDESKEQRTFLGKKYTKVMMMHRAGLYRHHEDIENMVQVLELPLWGGKASLVLLLPFHVENLTRLDKLLTLELLSKWLEKTSITSVAISLPKANITSTFSLQKQLFALGLTDAWDQKLADFSGVSDKGKLHLGGVLHWASLELASQAGKGDTDLEEENIEKPKLFYADHPFIIFVRDNATGALLLMGALDHAEGEALHDEL
ncbi:serine (or cysteine) peptidase inhibitor, clade H, member 2 [Xiphias gladius]|uniref:serine (or cysteine) peptidase inhibitor, clade H, member 2 n=1 Tax=Xiphias gladius TaxID=8245 RepID=UPI001A98A6B1|nr:serine (or cysteine) peptidase inhibitor, clade H, member 2 [Xiphias gladius]XP_039997539.1 serine (or cysteine) peptidase inhibitor, clade H, member 2 [Xiphias gladius]XP_039997540.1 serine (or cysteine) peptidase inhibitor, clade H, member 2 [Xiphias gladius]XP_039997542.1 serine (or cysteine) peptidase inhibitor, clade H, member 2 [Xiphias gladius]XP_039997543.1 serine (or cysteine) peptidase inhibitor, clade H, member 2 [Xiphias gladius]